MNCASPRLAAALFPLTLIFGCGVDADGGGTPDGGPVSGSPPTVSIAAPPENAYVAPDAQAVAVHAIASADTLGVQFKLDGVDLGAEDTTAPFEMSWDAAFVPVGPHTLTAVARNSFGTTTSAPVTVTVELFAGFNAPIGAGGQDPTTVITSAIDANANILRGGVTWSAVETTAGTYDFSGKAFTNVENAVDQGSASGVRLIFPIVFGNSLYPSPALDGSEGAPGRAAYGDYAKALAAQWGTRVRLYEIWNEFSGGMGVPDIDADGIVWNDGTPQRYFAIQQAAYPKLKEGNPKAIVTGSINVFAKWYESNWLQTLADLGGGAYIDWVDMHTYPPDESTRRAENSARWMIDSLHPIFPTKPIIVSEYGYPSYFPRTQMQKAEDLARAYFSVRTVPNIRGMVWYQMRDAGTNATNKEHNFGLLAPDAAWTPHEAFYSFQDVAPIFRRAAYHGRASTGAANLWLLRFKDASGDVYVLWREEDGPESVSFSFTASAEGNLQVRPVKTTASAPAPTAYPFVSGANEVTIPAATMPKFIRVPSGVAVTPASSYGFSTPPVP